MPARLAPHARISTAYNVPGRQPAPRRAQSAFLPLLGAACSSCSPAAAPRTAAKRSCSRTASRSSRLAVLVRAGVGTTLLPELAVDAGLLMGTSLVTRPLQS